MISSKPIYLVDIFADIVAKVNANVIAQLKQVNAGFIAVNYQYGHPLEIIETLMEWTKSPSYQAQKYPLVALFQDFPENNDNTPGFAGTTTLHLIIANQTLNTYKAAERYEKNFKPVLYPVYQELLRQINYSSVFATASEDQIPHTKIDRLYWGNQGLYGNSKNIFNDFIDCIEITNLKLRVNLNFC